MYLRKAGVSIALWIRTNGFAKAIESFGLGDRKVGWEQVVREAGHQTQQLKL